MEPNKQFGKYEIIKLMGSGATSDVYLAKDTRLERMVALKILKPALVSDQQGFARFTQEAQTAGKLFHDHIATIFDMGEQDGRYFIAMQYIDGISLDKYINKNGPLPWADVQKLAAQVGGGLAYAHDEGFLHRDIKPSNIMISAKGDFALTDFGLTRAIMQTNPYSISGSVQGTPPYIPPEVWNDKEASERSDQYSLACVIDEAITGKVRFVGKTPQAIITKHLIEQPTFESYPGDVPENVRLIIQKALSKEPSDRFYDIKTFKNALASPKDFNVRAYLGKLEEKARTQEEKQALAKIKKKKRRKTWGIVISIISAFAIISCGILYLVFQNQFRSALSIFRGDEEQQVVTQTVPAIIAEQQEKTSTLPMQTALPTSTTEPTFTAQPESNVTETLESSATPTMIFTPTQTATSTQVVQVGDEEQVPNDSGIVIEVIENGNTGLVAYFLRGDGSAIEGKQVKLYSQKQDLSGHWITDQKLKSGYTDNAGSIRFNVDPGKYIVASESNGYNWGTAHDVEGQANVTVESGKTTQLVLRYSRLRIGFVYANGNMVDGKLVKIYTQQLNTSNQWVTDYKVLSEYTDNSGEVIFDMIPGNYIVSCDFSGYNWGDAVDVEGEANIPLKSGEVYQIVIHLGAIVVELKDQSGNPIDGGLVKIYYQEADVNNNPTAGSKINSNYTDNTGTVSFVLTPGMYVFSYGDNYYYNIEVLEGQTIITDGKDSIYED